MYFDHVALLIQEFDMEIKVKRDSDNVVANHLSRLMHDEDLFPLKEHFPN